MGIHDIFMLVPVRVRWWVVLAGLFVGSVLGLGACALVDTQSLAVAVVAVLVEQEV